MKKTTLALLAAISLSSCAPYAMKSSIADAIDTLFADNDKSNSPGASISIVKDGNALLSKAYGLADVEHHVPAATSTNYRLASVTKQFTATAAIMMVDRGKLSLDTHLAEVLPGTPKYAHDVRIRHLLNHTSGFVDYEDLIPDSQTVQVLDADVLALLNKVDTMYFPVGSKYQYSNSGYALLALVVEAMSGEPFARFLKKNIFDPLGMKRTVAYQQGISTVGNRAFGHSHTDTGFVRTDQSVTSAVLGDGGIYSSVEDLFKWDQELYANQLVSASLRQQSFTPGILNDGTHTKYGFGWNIEPYKNIPSMYHTGSTRGFRNAIFRLPDQHLTVIILTNRNEGEPIELARKIADLVLAQ
ncbi:MAG: Beta-lactamase protein [Bacteroidetes bacterium]|nr:Beta-lactamase protein [Bacteroidota bacterium]